VLKLKVPANSAQSKRSCLALGHVSYCPVEPSEVAAVAVAVVAAAVDGGSSAAAVAVAAGVVAVVIAVAEARAIDSRY